MKIKNTRIRDVASLYAFLLIVWGFYRALFQLPDDIEEFFLKPLIWLVPTMFFLQKERNGIGSLGWTEKNLFKSIYLAIGLGVIFVAVGILTNLGKYGGTIIFSSFGFTTGTFFPVFLITLVTAIVEETVFRGFIFNRLWQSTGEELFSNIVSTFGWSIIHLPVLTFVNHLTFPDLILRFFLLSVFGFGSAFIFARTKNISSSILLHIFWSWPIILFR